MRHPPSLGQKIADAVIKVPAVGARIRCRTHKRHRRISSIVSAKTNTNLFPNHFGRILISRNITQHNAVVWVLNGTKPPAVHRHFT